MTICNGRGVMHKLQRFRYNSLGLSFCKADDRYAVTCLQLLSAV